MAKAIGLDIGSRSVKLVEVDGRDLHTQRAGQHEGLTSGSTCHVDHHGIRRKLAEQSYGPSRDRVVARALAGEAAVEFEELRRRPHASPP